MKKLLLLIILSCSVIYSQDVPFHKGVNVTGWFQAETPRGIYFKKFTKKDFENLKVLGADVVRLPINLHSMTTGAPAYNLDTVFTFMLDQVITWCEELQINLILDNHTFDVNVSTANDLDKVLIPVWTNMAKRYKDRSHYIYYEILNEPHGITDKRWNEIQAATVKAIRQVDTVHTIIIGGSGWNSYNNLAAMPVYDDDNLIYTFHFYDPFIFTHQGAGWNTPSMEPLAGVPFPYNGAAMPQCPDVLKGTGVESSLKNYMNEGTAEKVRSLVNIAANFKKSRGVKLFCGEFGVLRDNAPDSSRTYWYSLFRQYLEAENIPWTIWDYKGSFGLFKKNTNEFFDYNLNIPMVKALGFNEVPQLQYTLKPDTTGFDLFSGLAAENLYLAGSAVTDFWNTTEVLNNTYSLYWAGAKRYNTINFSFSPVKDLSLLLEKNYILDLYVKAKSPVQLDARFIDTKEDNNDHPWRMRYILDSTKINYNGTWSHVSIPLNSFAEHGSWDNNQWFNPEGKFSWHAVDRFELDAEYSDFGNAEFWFDDIRIIDPELLAVQDNYQVNSYSLAQNYPNPFNPATTISYSINKQANIILKVYDIIGKEIATLVNEQQQPGSYKIVFDAGSLASGMYLYTLNIDGKVSVKKMMLLR